MGHIQPWGWRLHTPWQAEKAIHQLMLNRLMSTASICPYCGLEVESRQLNIYFFSAQKWATECQPYFNNSRDKSDVIQNSDNLVEFLTALGHLPPPPYKQCLPGLSRQRQQQQQGCTLLAQSKTVQTAPTAESPISLSPSFIWIVVGVFRRDSLQHCYNTPQ